MGLLDSYPRQDSKRQLSIEEKLEAIRRVTDLGETKASVSRMYGVPESTLRGWCKNKDKLKLLSVNKQRSSDTKRRSDKKEPHYEGLLVAAQPPTSPETKKVKMDIDLNGGVDSGSEATPPVAHSNAFPMQISPTVYDFPRLLALYCAQAGPQGVDASPEEEPLSLVKRNRDYSDPPSDNEDDDDDEVTDESALEAIGHGEQFLRWLEGVSDPSITRLQLLQFRCLLDKVKTASFSRKLKSESIKTT